MEMIKPSWNSRTRLRAAMLPLRWVLELTRSSFMAELQRLKLALAFLRQGYPKQWIAWENLSFSKKISVLVHAAQRLLWMAFSSHGQKLSLLRRWKGGELGRGAPGARTGSPAGCGVSLTAGAAPVGRLDPACHCRAGLSLPGLRLQQPEHVGHPSTHGRGSRMGSTSCPTVGAKASTVWGGWRWHTEKLGFSLVLEEEEDLGAPLNSVLPCFLASWRACLCLIALVISSFLFVGGGGEGRWGTFYLKPEVFVISIQVN